MIRFLFGCPHTHQSWPFTLGGKTYQCCLDCGKELAFSVAEWRQLTPREIRKENAA